MEREYNLDLVTTAPGVIYQVHKTNGEVIDLTNPSNLPDPSEIEYMEEPIVMRRDHGDNRVCRCDHAALPGTPRSVYIGMEYMEETRALLEIRASAE